MKVLVKKLDPTVKLPSYKTKGASGMDLLAFIENSINIKPQTSKLISTGLSVAFPKVTRSKLDLDLVLQQKIILVF